MILTVDDKGVRSWRIVLSVAQELMVWYIF